MESCGAGAVAINVGFLIKLFSNEITIFDY